MRYKACITFLLIALSLSTHARERREYDFLLSLNIRDVRIRFLPGISNARYEKVSRYVAENETSYRQEIVNGLRETFNTSDRFYLVVNENERNNDFFPIFADVAFSMDLRQNNDPTLSCQMTLYIMNRHNQLVSLEGEVWLKDEHSGEPLIEVNRVIAALFKEKVDFENLAGRLAKEEKYRKFTRLSPPAGPGNDSAMYSTADIVEMLKGIQKEIVALKRAGRYYAKTEKAVNIFLKGYDLMNYSKCFVLRVKEGKKWPQKNTKVMVTCGTTFSPEEFTIAEHNSCDDADNAIKIDCRYNGDYVIIIDKVYGDVIRRLGLKNIRDSVEKLKKKVCIEDNRLREGT